MRCPAHRRKEVGAAARREVCLWDWRAATLHLLNEQYPQAMAAAAAYYAKKQGQAAAAAGGCAACDRAAAATATASPAVA